MMMTLDPWKPEPEKTAIIGRVDRVRGVVELVARELIADGGDWADYGAALELTHEELQRIREEVDLALQARDSAAKADGRTNFRWPSVFSTIRTSTDVSGGKGIYDATPSLLTSLGKRVMLWWSPLSCVVPAHRVTFRCPDAPP